MSARANVGMARHAAMALDRTAVERYLAAAADATVDAYDDDRMTAQRLYSHFIMNDVERTAEYFWPCGDLCK